MLFLRRKYAQPLALILFSFPCGSCALDYYLSYTIAYSWATRRNELIVSGDCTWSSALGQYGLYVVDRWA